MTTRPDVHRTISGIREALAQARRDHPGRPVALVPTMGALHEGHLAHVRRARAMDAIIVVSIFVNPLQFGEGEDLDRYPRTLDADVAALAGEGAHLVFAPAVGDMYPGGPPSTTVHAGGVADLFEGAARPGHFDGVLTVVAKLLTIVAPDVVTFGRKDAQQLFLVRRMIADLNIPARLEEIPIVREGDGLARSSRNRYLSVDERRQALALPRALQALAARAPEGVAAGLETARGVIDEVAASLGDESGVEPVRLEYLHVVDPATFRVVTDDHRGEALAVIAARVGSTRLIDNETIEVGPRADQE